MLISRKTWTGMFFVVSGLAVCSSGCAEVEHTDSVTGASSSTGEESTGAGGVGGTSGTGGGAGMNECHPNDIGECYSGPEGTMGVGICVGGNQKCSPQDGTWGACENEQTPLAEACDDGLDNNCNGEVDEGCAVPPPPCTSGGNIWHFGQNAGLDFNGGAPVAIQGPVFTDEGSATLADCAGNLLVTTDGATAYDRNGNPMPNGSGLGGGNSSLQSALLFAEAGVNSNVVHLFSVTEVEVGLGPLHHSRIDMNANGGLGDVVALEKAQDLSPGVIITERLIGVKHANGIDNWVVVHGWGTDLIQAYRVSSGEIDAPVESHVGTVAMNVKDWWGAFAASKDGKRLATAFFGSGVVDLYDFDAEHGTASLALSFVVPTGGYGTELSPNGKVLYLKRYPNGELYQYDLSSMSSSMIVASKVSLDPGSGPGQIKRGPDGRLYTVSWPALIGYVGVVANPDMVGIGAGFDPIAIELLGGTSSIMGLPNTPPGLY